jgi:hypothetical protein
MSPIVDPSGDNINCSHAVETQNHDVEGTVPGISVVELSTGLARVAQAPLPTQLSPLSHMATAALVDHCRHEISRYRRGEHQDGPHCVELFRRATLQNDQDAWQAVRQCLGKTVLRWLDRHPAREAACHLNTEEHYVTQAFERFSQATVQQQIAFSTLADALLSLRAYLNSALLDAMRASSRSREIQVSRHDKAEQLEANNAKQNEVWEMLRSLLPDLREQRLAFLLYHCGLGPRDIVHTYPQEFPDVEEIFRLRHKLIHQLLDHVDQLY